MSDGQIKTEGQIEREARARGCSRDLVAREFESIGGIIRRTWFPHSAETCDRDTFEPQSRLTLGQAVASCRQSAVARAARREAPKVLGDSSREADSSGSS